MMQRWGRTTSFAWKLSNPSKIMPKKRLPSMNLELLEYIKFVHIHNLVDIIAIIDSIPIYYQTQVRKYSIPDIDRVNLQKMKLQNLTYIAHNLFEFSFPNFIINFQTWRVGPYSLDLDNGIQNLIYSEIFNNAISSRKTFSKRYKLSDYDKEYLIEMFKGHDNYRNFLSLVDGRDIYFLKDISLLIYLQKYIYHCGVEASNIYSTKILKDAVKGMVSYNNDEYIQGLIEITTLPKPRS
jgi:hypothetical protein